MPGADETRSAERLFQRVREQIAQGRYRPGQRINIAGRASEFGTSATPMREALSRLVGRDLAYELRGEGFYLNLLTTSDITSLYELHGHCIDRILRGPLRLASPPPSKSGEGMWPVFASLAILSANRILSDLQRYLDDRLTVTRHAERTQISAMDKMATDLRHALSRADNERARQISEHFHELCHENAPVIMQMMML